jgi:hypothetical protein
MCPSMMINAGSLFAVAKEACARAQASDTNLRSHVSHDPLVAIVFAAAAGEAFINEISCLADQRSMADPGFDPDPREVHDLISLLSAIEDSHVPTSLKFLIAKLALTGQTYDRGASPYQDFAILMELRNSLVHLRSEGIEGEEIGSMRVKYPRVADKLRAKNVLAQLEDEAGLASWLFVLSTAAAAMWACNAASSIVKDLVESIPESGVRRSAEFLYFENHAFTPMAQAVP